MNEASVKQYSTQADRMERDPYGPDGSGRAVVVNGRGFRWSRFHRDEELVWVTALDGRPVALTPTQLRVYLACRDLIGQSVTMTALATSLRVSVSTVSRAMTKLMSFGLITYLTGRGRSARTVIMRAFKNDGMDRLRREAKARVRRWSEAAQRRLSRLQTNLAPYIHEGRGRDSLTDYLYTLPSTQGAMIRPWIPEDMRELDREMGCES